VIAGSDFRHLERLPEAGKAKVLLLDGLGEDALQAAQGAQSRLNAIARRPGGPAAGDPNIPRLTGIIERSNERHQSLHSLVGAIMAWLRSLPVGATLEAAPEMEAPKLTEGERFEQALARMRNDIGILTVELGRVMAAPPPKSEVKKGIRPFVENLMWRAEPRLRVERGKTFEAIFLDHQRDLGLSEGWVAGVAAWLDPERFARKLEAMVEALPQRGALSDSDQRQKLAALKAEIERLGRIEEALIEQAFAAGTDIQRRPGADPWPS